MKTALQVLLVLSGLVGACFGGFGLLNLASKAEQRTRQEAEVAVSKEGWTVVSSVMRDTSTVYSTRMRCDPSRTKEGETWYTLQACRFEISERGKRLLSCTVLKELPGPATCPQI